ncbi:MAG: ATP-binding protein [Candidatus Zixiibacteriota bacterium]|nr:MAG: ATP-binding protein [candidate division Zixibacteria bacterium]
MLRDLVGVLDEHSVTGFPKHSILVVISEAFTNALLHGNRLDPNKKIKIVIEINKSEMIADIIDEGQGGLRKIRKRPPSHQWAEGGRGIGIIGHYASSVDFAQTERGGLRVTIKFARRDKREYKKA